MTSVRPIVENVHTFMKINELYKRQLDLQVVDNSLLKYLKITSSSLNRFGYLRSGKGIRVKMSSELRIAELNRDRPDNPLIGLTLVAKAVLATNRRTLWENMDMESAPFPQLSLENIRNLAVSDYRMREAKSRLKMFTSSDVWRRDRFQKLKPESQRRVFNGIYTNPSQLTFYRTDMMSKYNRSEKIKTHLLYFHDEELSDFDRFKFVCNCASGENKFMCVHTCLFISFLAYYRHHRDEYENLNMFLRDLATY